MDWLEERHERGEENRIIEQPVDPRQLIGQLQQLRRKHCLPQRHLIAYSTKHDGLDPFSHKGLRPSSLFSTVNPRINAPTFSGRSS